ncbi:Macrolide export ATP-binding/permease protein MacB [bioreactor metagenome]|uniref:Macrolide export ATP-binding/permease protein MacB n=1 Tax=bioreactor metagenome TaxID=1076179 RepID=A0A644WHC3_9ZZZZ
MKIRQALKMAAKSISANKGRSALTMLGIVIGLAAVIILVSYAKGQNQVMKEYYESLGTNKINVSAYSWNSQSMSDALYDYCLQLDDLVLGVTPNLQLWNSVNIKFDAKSLTPDNSDGMYPQVVMGSDQYSLCNNYSISQGRDLSYLDVKEYNQVCVLGSGIKDYLFNYANPVGQVITINGSPFTVIGVFDSKSTTKTQDMVSYLDNIVLVPYTMNRLLNGSMDMSEYVVKAKSSEATTEAITRLDGFLSGLIDPNYGYYYVYSDNSWQQQSNQQNELQQRFLGGIAAISLLVGGIGIMNIMLVTVTERTREIGIRKAIGAERMSIITQFLIEAAMICLIGGIIGIAVGYVGTLIVCKKSFDIIMLPGVGITVASFFISVAIGIIFGLYPAIKASGLQPVEALRSE